MRMDRNHPRCRPKKNNTQIMRVVTYSRNHEARDARHNQEHHPHQKRQADVSRRRPAKYEDMKLIFDSGRKCSFIEDTH